MTHIFFFRIFIRWNIFLWIFKVFFTLFSLQLSVFHFKKQVLDCCTLYSRVSSSSGFPVNSIQKYFVKHFYVELYEKQFLFETFFHKIITRWDILRKLRFHPLSPPPERGKRTSWGGKLSRVASGRCLNITSGTFTHFGIFSKFCAPLLDYHDLTIHVLENRGPKFSSSHTVSYTHLTLPTIYSV